MAGKERVKLILGHSSAFIVAMSSALQKAGQGRSAPLDGGASRLEELLVDVPTHLRVGVHRAGLGGNAGGHGQHLRVYVKENTQVTHTHIQQSKPTDIDTK